MDDSKVQAISLLPRFELIGSHSFVDMQEVVEGKDYEKSFQGWNFIERKWERVISTEYDSLLDPARRIISLPLPITPSQPIQSIIMTHNTTVTTEVFAALQGRQRHLIVKDNSLYATGDTLNANLEGTRDQLPFEIVSIEHGPSSKTINGHYCLVGLYAPYGSVDDLPGTVG